MARMTQDALHPAEMKGKPHQSQKAIKASRKKKAYREGGGVDPEATKRHARNKKKLRAMAEKKKQDFLDAAKKVGGKASVRQGRSRATVRNIKASDVDKKRSARMVSKKAEKARAKNDPKRAAKAKAAKAKMRKRMSIPAVNLLPGGMPISLAGITAGGELKMRHGGPVKKDQGYNARLDESMGARNKTKKQQSLKSRRHESEAMEKKGGRRKFAAVKTMDKGSRTKKKPRGVGAALRGWGKAHHG